LSSPLVVRPTLSEGGSKDGNFITYMYNLHS
jgi:hypothetical protein